MAEKTINATIKTRNDTSTNWTTVNPVLAVGEIGFETDTFLFKVGNGTSTWSLLPYTRTKYDSAGNSILDTYVSNIDLSGNTITALNKSGVSVDSVSLTTNNVTATTTNRYVPAIPSSNSSSMYLNGDGVFVSIVTGGATSVENLYLSNTASDVSGYKTINYTAASTATEISVSCTNSADVLSYSYLYPTAIGTTTIDAGMWKSSFSMKSSVTNGINRLRLDCFVRTTSGTETILFSKYTVSVNTTSYSRYSTETNRNIFTVNSTDRLGFKVYGNTDRAASTTITYRIGGADPSYINTPLPLRHAELRDKNGESGYQHLTQTQVDKLNGIETGAQVNTVTGVKGNSETTYRTGNINITPTNIGLGNVNNTADSTKSVASAAQLTTARTIAISGGATGTATSFNGSSNISIPVTNILASYLKWGGKTQVGVTSPIDMALNNEFNANRLAFMDAGDILIEYSNDNGSTWSEYTTSDESKINLVTSSYSYSIGGHTSNISTSDKLRITITASEGKLYTSLKEIQLQIDTHGATGSNVTLQYRTIANYNNSVDTWDTITSNQTISGRSGWNTLNSSFFFGGSASQTSQVRQVRLTFGITGLNGTSSSALSLLSIRMYGENIWSSSNNYQRTGHIYAFDASQNVTFPAKVSSSSFIGKLIGNSDTSTSSVNIIDQRSSSGYKIWIGTQSQLPTKQDSSTIYLIQ